jgi:hypothetical protein
MTERTQQGFEFEGHFSWRVAAEFSGEQLTTKTMRANQLRLYFSSVAYVLLYALRRIALRGSKRAQAGTVRLRLLKIAVQVRVSAADAWGWFLLWQLKSRATSKQRSKFKTKRKHTKVCST